MTEVTAPIVTNGGAGGPEPFATEEGSASAHLPPGHPSRAWRLFDRVVVSVFVIGLLVPGTLLLAGRHSTEVENRPLLRMPTLTLSGLADASWATGVGAFLADNVAVRPYAVRLRGEAEWLSGGTGNPAVVRGRSGWLFTIGEFQPDCRLTAGQVVEGLDAAAAGFTAAGQTFRFVAIPDKHVVYPDELAGDPFPAACSEAGRAALRAGLADLGGAGIDGFSALQSARAASPDGPLLYFPLDTHWTPTGAIAVLRPLVDSIDPATWDAVGLHRSGTSRVRDDLANQMGIRRTGTVPGYVTRPGITVTREDVPVPVTLHNTRAIFRTTSTGSSEVIPGRTVIVYDSFFGIDVSLVAPFFADATWIHVGDLSNDPELGRLLGPFDTVVVERVERGIYSTDLQSIAGALVR